MNFYAINASPRKHNNTATLLQAALDGVQTGSGAEPATTQMVHLYDLEYKACMSCFQCKRLGGKSYGKCVLKDPLSPLMEQLSQADGIFFGSPIYYGNITGKLKIFFERFLFQYSVYDTHYSSLAPRRMPTAFIYTMNVSRDVMYTMEYEKNLKDIDFFVGNIFSKPQVLYANDTYQFDDYAKYKVECFSETEKTAHREHQFPLDCQQAHQMGINIAEAAIAAR